MKKNIIAVVLALTLGLTALAMAKNDNAGGGKTKGNNSDKTSQSPKMNKPVNLKNFERADRMTGKTNAQLHKEKIQEVVKNLEQAAKNEKSVGNPGISNEVVQVAEQEEAVETPTTQAIAEVEHRGKIKTFLLGTDYKNLGQLRSSLVHNRNQIRALTRTLSLVQASGGDTALIQGQLETLMQERERIKSVITANESSFSIFGWIAKFISGYEKTPVDDAEETQLTTEVEKAIQNTENGDEEVNTNNTPVTGGTTAPQQ